MLRCAREVRDATRRIGELLGPDRYWTSGSTGRGERSSRGQARGVPIWVMFTDNSRDVLGRTGHASACNRRRSCVFRVSRRRSWVRHARRRYWSRPGNGASAPSCRRQLRSRQHEILGCSDESCFQQAFGNIAYYQGPKAALALVDDVYGDGGNAACPRVAHAIGAASLARYEGSVGRTFAQGSSICGSGYYHGVLERSLVNVRSRTPEALGAAAQTLCKETRSRVVPWVLGGVPVFPWAGPRGS